MLNAISEQPWPISLMTRGWASVCHRRSFHRKSEFRIQDAVPRVEGTLICQTGGDRRAAPRRPGIKIGSVRSMDCPPSVTVVYPSLFVSRVYYLFNFLPPREYSTIYTCVRCVKFCVCCVRCVCVALKYYATHATQETLRLDTVLYPLTCLLNNRYHEIINTCGGLFTMLSAVKWKSRNRSVNMVINVTERIQNTLETTAMRRRVNMRW